MTETAELNHTAEMDAKSTCTVPATTRSSKDIQADIDRLNALMAAEVQNLDRLETSEGTDYQQLLAVGPTDTTVIDQIAKSSAQIAVLQRALVAANADFLTATQNELHGRRVEARDAIQAKFDRCNELTRQVDTHLDKLAKALNDLYDVQRSAATDILGASRTLGIKRDGYHLMEARSALENGQGLGNLLELALHHKTGLVRPAHIPPGYKRPIAVVNGETYTHAMLEVNEALGLTGGN